MAGKRDYYEVLGVDRRASPEEIRRAYRRLARQYHPDVNRDDPTTEAKFKEIAEAHEVLRDPSGRAEYDRFGHAGRAGVWGPAGVDPFGGFGDLFESFFGGFRPAAPAREHRGADLRASIEITLEEAAAGLDKVIRISRRAACQACEGTGSESRAAPERCPACSGLGEIHRRQSGFLGVQMITTSTCARCGGEGTIVSDPCARCRGRRRERRTEQITVRVPPGVESGTHLRLSGEGDAGTHGAAPGDLYVAIEILPHPRFERRGLDLITEQLVPFTLAALGGKVTVTLLEGERELAVPPGTQTGQAFRIEGAGMPELYHGRRGDLIVVARVVVPRKLTAKQRKLLEQFSAAGGDAVEDDRGFFARLRGERTG